MNTDKYRSNVPLGADLLRNNLKTDGYLVSTT